jgi:hypothetical protein
MNRFRASVPAPGHLVTGQIDLSQRIHGPKWCNAAFETVQCDNPAGRLAPGFKTLDLIRV